MAKVENWCDGNPRCDGNLGLLREEMPQIPEEVFPAFLSWLEDQDVSLDLDLVSVSDLIPTQAEIDKAKVEKMEGSVRKDQPLIIASGGHILDGHHRWAALVEEDPSQTILVIKVGLSIRRLLEMALAYDGSEQVTIKGKDVKASRRQRLWSDLLS